MKIVSFLLPLLLQLPLSVLGDRGVYKSMLKGDLRRFAIKTSNPKATLAPQESIQTLYDEVDFDETDISSTWLAKYIRWHHQARLSPDENTKYLVVEPGRGDSLTSHLKHLPYYLMLAAQYQRVLVLTNWDLSSSGDVCGLHDFLQPSLVDWTLSEEVLESETAEVMPDTDMNHFNRFVGDRIMEEHQDTQTLLVRGSQLSYILGLDRVFMYSNKDPMVFKYIYKSLFRLTEPVQQMVDDTKLGLMDQDYLGVYTSLPGVYGQLYRSYLQGPPILEDPHAYDNIQQKMLEVGNQALERAQHVVKDDETYVAYMGGDTVESMTLLRQDHSDEMEIAIFEDAIAFAHNGGDDCSRFYHELVDLYVLAEAKCIVFGNDDAVGEVATLMNGLECWSTYEHNTMIASMGPKSPFAHNQEPILPGQNVATPLGASIVQTS